jgi:single-stranded DNA-specific DHH superfamily exonuclease
VEKLKKSEVVEKTITPAVEFIKKIKAFDRVAIVHDDDCDGICSGVVLATLIKDIYNTTPHLFSTEWNVSLTKRIVEDVLRVKPTKIIIVDSPELPKTLLSELKEHADILVIDHHTVEKYGGVVYCNPRIYDPKMYMPVSYLTYKISQKLMQNTKNTMWIAAIGSLGDYGVNDCEDLFIDTKNNFPELIGDVNLSAEDLWDKSLLGKLVKIVDSGRVVSGRLGAELVSNTLFGVKGYKELLEGATENTKILLKWYGVAEKELDRLIEDFEKGVKQIGKNVLFYELESKLSFKSTLATAVQKFYDSKIIVIGQKCGEYFDMSLRRGRKMEIDLGNLVKTVISNIPRSNGGGHPEAAGARVPVKYLELFLDNLMNKIT